MRSTRWSEAVVELERTGDAFVIATIVGTSGSTPRHTASKMVIAGGETYDTVGGGQLEHLIVLRARALLANGIAAVRLEHVPLALDAGQCCGGAVTVLLEAFAANPFVVTVYGAGHVAQRLVPILAEASCRLTWVDPRRDLLIRVPPHVATIVVADPVNVARDARDGSYAIVLTHEHALDYALVKVLLTKELAYVGLIGSETKAKRFRLRLEVDGVPAERIARLVCPIAAAAGRGEQPIEVAVAIAAEVLALGRKRGVAHRPEGMRWRDIKRTLREIGST